MKGRILIVDDEQNIRSMLQALLEQEGYEVQQAGSGLEALAACDSLEPDVVLLDLVMPSGPDGIAVLEQLRTKSPDLVVIMMSGKATLRDAVRATQLGAFQFLEKPITPEGVIVAVSAAIDLSRAHAENRALRATLEKSHAIVGTSSAIDEVRMQVNQVAPTPARVLISGESGTGKELVARAIHRASPRESRPLVTVNCAAIPRELVESELFGHERGAFTGASERHHGKFELAHGGSLFLDEVGDLEPAVQAKLLRVLETGVIERVGGERARRVDVRVISATNKDLEHKSGSGGFRADLFYRLNVFPIHIPPLRERLEDVPALVAHLASLSGARCGRAPISFAPAAVERLKAHTWPGNVRELANVVERLTIVAEREPVTAAAVDAVLSGRASRAQPVKGHLPGSGGLSEELDAYEARLIKAAIAEADGNVADAARRLRTDRANLYRRMRRLGIEHRDTSVSK